MMEMKKADRMLALEAQNSISFFHVHHIVMGHSPTLASRSAKLTQDMPRVQPCMYEHMIDGTTSYLNIMMPVHPGSVV